MTSSSEARPSVRLALAEARAMRTLAEPTSPSGIKREVSMPARHDEAATTNGGDDFYVTPVAVAIDRTGGHAAMREDILLPLDGKKSRAERVVSLSEHLIGNQKAAPLLFVQFILVVASVAHQKKLFLSTPNLPNSLRRRRLPTRPQALPGDRDGRELGRSNKRTSARVPGALQGRAGRRRKEGRRQGRRSSFDLGPTSLRRPLLSATPPRFSLFLCYRRARARRPLRRRQSARPRRRGTSG